MFLRNGRVFREPRTKWLQLEPGDSALALTGQAGLKVDDHFFTVYDVPATRLAIIGWRAGTRGRLHFRGLDPETKPQGREACGHRGPFLSECGVVLESLAVDMTKEADRRLPFSPLFLPRHS